MARLAELQRQIDEASEEVRHLTHDEQNRTFFVFIFQYQRAFFQIIHQT